jgi:hypothetical protein
MQNLTEYQALQTVASVEASVEAKQKEVILTPAEERAAVLELRRLAYVELSKATFKYFS